MDGATVRALLEKHGLGRHAEALLALAAPTIRVYERTAEDEDIPIGASKLGGQPDLPQGVEWPAWHESMAFLAQFNLAEVAPFDQEHALHAEGLLSFFYETDGEPLYAQRWGFPEDAPYTEEYMHPEVSRSWRVLYLPGDPATLKRRPIPENLNERGRYHAAGVRFASEITLPYVDGPEVWLLGLTEEERSMVFYLEDQINRGEWNDGGHHLLGYPYNMEGPPLVSCAAEAAGLPDTWADAGEEGRWAIEREVNQRWRLLLQLSGSGLARMDWAGSGYLCFAIERAALTARDFSRAWLDMQFL